MKLLVDTHLLLWLALGSSKLSTQARTVIEDPGTTIVIHPGNRVAVDGFGNIHIHLGEA